VQTPRLHEAVAHIPQDLRFAPETPLRRRFSWG